MRISTDIIQSLNEQGVDVSSAWMWCDADVYDQSYRQVLEQPISLESLTLDFCRWKVSTVTITIRVAKSETSDVVWAGQAVLIDDSQAVPDQSTTLPLIYTSTGMVGPQPSITDNGDGTITIGPGTVVLRTDTTSYSNLLTYNLLAATFTIPQDSQTYYICAKYANGAAAYYLEVLEGNINARTIIPVYAVWNILGVLSYQYFGSNGDLLSNKIDYALVDTVPYKISVGGGLIISETNRVWSATSAVVYAGTTPHQIGAIAASNTNLIKAYTVSGVWNYSPGSNLYDNTNYDNGSNVVALGVGKYAVRWIFRSMSAPDQLYYVLGLTEYSTAASAEDEPLRTDLPELITKHSMLIGKAIIQNGASAGITESTINTSFSGGAISSNHNSLGGIYGDSPFYHLNQNAYTQVNNVVALSGTGLLKLTNKTPSIDTTSYWYSGNHPSTLSAYSIAASDTLFDSKYQPLKSILTSIGNLGTSSTGLVKITNGTASYDTNTYLTSNQSISLSGAVTGSGTTSIATAFANTHLAGINQDLTTTSSPTFAKTTIAGANYTVNASAPNFAAIYGSSIDAAHIAFTWALDGTQTYVNAATQLNFDIGAKDYATLTSSLFAVATPSTFTGLITANGGISGNLSGNATTATTADAVAWTGITSKPTGIDNVGVHRLYREDGPGGYWLSPSWSSVCFSYFGSNSWYLTASNSQNDSQGGIYTVFVDYAGLSVNSQQLGGIAASSYLLSSTAASTYLPFSTITPFSVGSVSINNYWGKLATLTITSQWGSASAVVRVADGGGDASALNFAATIKVNIKQQSAMTDGLNYMACDLESSVGINPADVRLIKTVDTSSTKTCELWIKWRQQYSNIKCFGENNGAATFASSTLVSAPTTALSYVTAGSNSNFVNILTATSAVYSKYGTIDGQYYSTSHQYAGFGHKSCTSAGNYCLLQDKDGHSFLNGSTTLNLQINNQDIAVLSSSAITLGAGISLTSTDSAALGGVAADYFVQGQNASRTALQSKAATSQSLLKQSGFYCSPVWTDAPVASTWTHLIHTQYADDVGSSNNWSFDIAANFGSAADPGSPEGYYVRAIAAGSSTGWRQLIHSSNYTSYNNFTSGLSASNLTVGNAIHTDSLWLLANSFTISSPSPSTILLGLTSCPMNISPSNGYLTLPSGLDVGGTLSLRQWDSGNLTYTSASHKGCLIQLQPSNSITLPASASDGDWCIIYGGAPAGPSQTAGKILAPGGMYVRGASNTVTFLSVFGAVVAAFDGRYWYAG